MIGAILLGSMQQIVTVTISSEVNVLVVGVLLVVFVVAAPEGILGLVRRVRRNRNEGEDDARETELPLLRIARVSKRFGGFAALDSVSLDIRPGERFGLIGPNGSGKTTLINCISGALRNDAGSDRCSTARRSRGCRRISARAAASRAASRSRGRSPA